MEFSSKIRFFVIQGIPSTGKAVYLDDRVLGSCRKLKIEISKSKTRNRSKNILIAKSEKFSFRQKLDVVQLKKMRCRPITTKLHVVQFFVEKIDVVHLGLKKELSSSFAVVQIYSPPCTNV